MQSLYLSLFEEYKGEYEKALGRGDIEAARSYAIKCAQILKLLAEKIPGKREFYLQKAASWENAAGELESRPLSAQRSYSSQGTRTEDEYRSHVERLISSSTVTWNDIGGLYEVKKILAQNVALAFAKKPDAIKPWKGILLFGPPGTGKTLFASAAAGSLRATFFNVKASDVLSKYFGESSKLITALYAAARESPQHSFHR